MAVEPSAIPFLSPGSRSHFDRIGEPSVWTSAAFLLDNGEKPSNCSHGLSARSTPGPDRPGVDRVLAVPEVSRWRVRCSGLGCGGVTGGAAVSAREVQTVTVRSR